MLHCLLLVWVVASVRSGAGAPPPVGLEDAPDWLLAETLHQPPRRITPKSVFVAPTFSACGPGYRQDNGRCVRVVKVNQQAQWDFFLQKLNAMYAPPEPTKNRRTQGPLHVALPIDPPTTPMAPTTVATSTTDSPQSTTTEVPTTTMQETTPVASTARTPATTGTPVTSVTQPVTSTPVTEWETTASTVQSTWSDQETESTSTENFGSSYTTEPTTPSVTDFPSPSHSYTTENYPTYGTSTVTETTTNTEPTTAPPGTHSQVNQEAAASSDQVVLLDLPVKAKCSQTFQVTSLDSDSLPVNCEEVPVPARLSLPPVRTPPPHIEVQTIHNRNPYTQHTLPELTSPHVQTYSPQTHTVPVRTPVRFPERRRPARPSFVRFPDRTWGYWWPAWDRRAPSSFQRVEHYPAGWGYHSHNTAHPQQQSALGSVAS